MKIMSLGLMDFSAALAIQEGMAASLAEGKAEETLLLLEHPPVYTIGSGGSGENVLDASIEALRTNRGGDVTYHGPGQLVCYPIIDLSRRGRDLHIYLRFLEEVIIRVAGDYGVAARRLAGRTGVWCADGGQPSKLASIGVGVRRWVTMHGFALNVANDITPFSRINPCGIVSCPVTSLCLEMGRAVTLHEVTDRVAQRFELIMEELLPCQ